MSLFVRTIYKEAVDQPVSSVKKASVGPRPGRNGIMAEMVVVVLYYGKESATARAMRGGAAETDNETACTENEIISLCY